MNDLKETKTILLSSWKLFKTRATILVAFFFIYLIISAFASIILHALPENLPLKSGLQIFVLLLLYSVFSICHIRNMNYTIKQQPFSMPHLNDEKRTLMNHFFATILYSAIVSIGILFFIIPGIYWAIRLQFYSYAIIEKGLGAIESIRYSWHLTRNASTELLILTAYALLVLCVGLILFILGIFIAIPYILMIQCYTHKILSKG